MQPSWNVETKYLGTNTEIMSFLNLFPTFPSVGWPNSMIITRNIMGSLGDEGVFENILLSWQHFLWEMMHCWKSLCQQHHWQNSWWLWHHWSSLPVDREAEEGKLCAFTKLETSFNSLSVNIEFQTRTIQKLKCNIVPPLDTLHGQHLNWSRLLFRASFIYAHCQSIRSLQSLNLIIILPQSRGLITADHRHQRAGPKAHSC